MVVVRLDRLAALNHVPKPPTEREVLETSPAHEAAQPPATIARGDGGVVRPVVCPAAPAQSEGVVASRHVPAFGLSLIIIICNICHRFVLRPDRATSVAYARASVGGTTAALSGAPHGKDDSGAHTRTDVPEPDVRLDVADVLPGRGLARPSEQKQMLPVRASESDVLEGEGRPRVSFPARALDFNAVE